MRFLDANIFIYAYYKPVHDLSSKRRAMKEKSKEIVDRINEGETVITAVVHLSEVSNILKRALPLDKLATLLIGLYSSDNIKIVDVTKNDYLGAIELMDETKMDPNDSLAIQIMRREEIKEIYSFDRSFEGVDGIKRLPEF
ncbi:MAG: type II toxin-antitoxin system VapC family toxin [Methanosarcinales archaeon Met12]|nr:MAG: type II toxin-antitoxin system VapC family toxin [Methanosarcinales archaeon Met12]